MKNAKKYHKFNKNKKLGFTALIALASIVVIATAVYGINKIEFYNEAATRTNIVQIRELILLAVRGVKKNAPVEPMTGDIYFPDARLYVPNPKLALDLTYSNADNELSVSTYPVWGTEELYNSNTQTELFNAVPKLQACSRGVKLVYQKYPSSDTANELLYTTRLSGSKVIYIYIEKACSNLRPIADSLKDIRTY